MFALKGMPQDSQSDDDDEQGGEEEDDIEDLLYAAAAAEKDKRKKKAKGKGKKGKGKEDESDEDSESESEEEEGWGAKKSAYYASNAEQIESDDEEANELEEQEARRLQAKARDTMVEDDFGLGDVVEGLPEDDGYVLCSTRPRSVPHSLEDMWTNPHSPSFSNCLRTSRLCYDISKRRTQKPWPWRTIGKMSPILS